MVKAVYLPDDSRATSRDDLGITDSSLVVLAARYDTRDLRTLDHRHLRPLAPLQGGRFQLLPRDG